MVVSRAGGVCSGETWSTRVFVVEVAGLWRRPAAYPMNGAVRPDGRARLQIPYSRMGAEMQRLRRLGARIISVNVLEAGDSHGTRLPMASQPNELVLGPPDLAGRPESLGTGSPNTAPPSEDLSEQTQGDHLDPTRFRDTLASLNSGTPLPTPDTQASEAEGIVAVDRLWRPRPAGAEAEIMSPLEEAPPVPVQPLTIAVEPHLPPPTSASTPQVSSETLVTGLAWGVGSIQAVILLMIGVQIFQTAHHLPLVPEVMQLLGTGVSLWWVYRWLLFAADRRAAGAQVTALKEAILGAPSPGQPLQIPLKLTLSAPEEDLVERVQEVRAVEILNLPSQDG